MTDQFQIVLVFCKGTSILGEVRNVEISRVTQQLVLGCPGQGSSSGPPRRGPRRLGGGAGRG